MKNQFNRLFNSLALLFTLSAQLATAFAQGAAFTYQGSLGAGGSLASGFYDLKFTIYDSLSGVVAGPSTNLNTGVTNGLFTVALDFGAGVFDGTSRFLEVGVRTSGGTNFTTLAPRQPITASPYAIRAANFSGIVAASQVTGTLASSNIGVGTITGNNLAVGAVTAASVASNSITANQLAAGAAAANLNAAGQSGVASGGMVLSVTDANTALLTAGFIRIGATTTVDVWLQRTNAGAPPSPRYGHTAVWTGSEMIIWGGTLDGNSYRSDAARYNPTANTWTTLSTNNAPAPRYLHTAVWTGSEMIVWGGAQGILPLNDGGRYNPANNSWIPIPNSLPNTPSARGQHTAIWTGSQMIIWGGTNMNFSLLNDGGRYNPTGNSWTSMQTRPSARVGHTAVWTGSEMIIFGGFDGGNYLNDIALYRPDFDFWLFNQVLPGTPPAPRAQHTAIWTGSNMIVWGGFNGAPLNDGGLFDATANYWTPLNYVGAPLARYQHTAVWTGAEMIVWGGYNSSYGSFNDGGRYNPAADSWTTVTSLGAPGGRYQHTAVWTGGEMIIYGGYNGFSSDFDTFSYTPGRTLFLYQRP